VPFTAIDLVLLVGGLVAVCPLALLGIRLRAPRQPQIHRSAEVVDLDAARRRRAA
jgi:hypothetical protein